MSNYQAALEFATEKHKDQVRKYTGEPYINHCIEVVEILERHGVTSETAKMAAVLHDTVEDTNTNFQELSDLFGKEVAAIVFFLTNVATQEQGNRKTRFMLNCSHILNSPYPLSLAIKCADLISNTRTIVERDPDFAKVYLEEKRTLLKDMMESPSFHYFYMTNPSLYNEAVALAGAA